MQFINYLSTTTLVYAGLLAGIILGYISKEEVKAGRKYFIIIQKIILLLIIISFSAYSRLDIILRLSIFFVLISSLIIIHFKDINILRYSLITYTILGIIFYISSSISRLFLINSSLIFLYGFPTGTLLVDFKKNNFVGILSRHSLFIVVAISSFFLLK